MTIWILSIISRRRGFRERFRLLFQVRLGVRMSAVRGHPVRAGGGKETLQATSVQLELGDDFVRG
jgi:hypothetical protein